jgi:hypothetical protein
MPTSESFTSRRRRTRAPAATAPTSASTPQSSYRAPVTGHAAPSPRTRPQSVGFLGGETPFGALQRGLATSAARFRLAALIPQLSPLLSYENPNRIELNRDGLASLLHSSDLTSVAGVTYPQPGSKDRIMLSPRETGQLGGYGLGGRSGIAPPGALRRAQKAAQQVAIHEIVHANQNSDAIRGLAEKLSDLAPEGDPWRDPGTVSHELIEGGAEYLSRKLARQLTGYRYPGNDHPYQPYINDLRREFGSRRLGSTLRNLLGG